MNLKRLLAALLAVTVIGVTRGWVAGVAAAPTLASEGEAAITVDYPEEGSIFPPEIVPPTFLWHDGSAAAASWRVDFAHRGRFAAHRQVQGGRAV